MPGLIEPNERPGSKLKYMFSGMLNGNDAKLN